MALDAFIDSTSLNNNLISIADTIRTKRGLPSTTKLTFPTDFIAEINRISGSGSFLGSKSITQNGTYNATDDSLDGYNSVIVDVNPSLGSKTITQNGTYNASDENLYGFSSITTDIRPGALIPTVYDSSRIYVNSTRIYNRSSDSAYRTDVYYIEASKSYLIALDGTIGDRFVATFTETNPESISAGSSVKGTNIINSTSPGTYAGTYFNSNTAGYIAITKDYNSTNELKTYVYSIQDIVNL